ncbi:DUF4179 domain-containing protein [uncultured Dysosmobacter sp.]|uniref:DUF4179 domain-containing protein n=1 Tax=uncultured Dysosmobacter sp. TaxID=2591384 RepID=UPI00262590E4|nr:DUF4179 domain-containing protein [uncultured Dysosmobacter sp.]
MFSETYQKMNESVTPSPELIQRTLQHAQKRRQPPLRRTAAIAAALTVLLATPALAARTEIGYQALYLIAPAAAQFFQPVRMSCTDNGLTMEVEAVRVEGDTAQAYITLSGDAVDKTCDLYDSYDFHLPFDQEGHCEQVAYDDASHSATFLCTVKTMSGQAIPTGGKMTFSVREFLSGKTVLKDAVVDLDLADYDAEAATAPTWSRPSEKKPNAFYCTGGGGTGGLENIPMLLPGDPLANPIPSISVSAAGYADGLFHIQVQLKNRMETDAHCFLWLEDSDGNRLAPLNDVYHTRGQGAEQEDYLDAVFDISPAELEHYTLHGDFIASSKLTRGNWRVTFLLENTFTEEALTEISQGHRTGSFDRQDTLLTFVSQLEQQEQRTIRGPEGYDYAFQEDTGDAALAVFTCPDGAQLQVRLEKIPYEDTTGLWQVTAYGWQEKAIA